MNKKRLHVHDDDAILKLSKGKCINNHPVFDLWIFENGQVIYDGIENVEKKGISKNIIPFDIVNRIKHLADHISTEEVGDSKGRDNALTMLKHKNKKFVFQSARVKGNLLELNNLLEYIAAIIDEEE